MNPIVTIGDAVATEGVAATGAVDEADVIVLDDSASDVALPAGAEKLPNGLIVLKLKFPVAVRTRATTSAEVVSEKFTQLTFRRMKGPDMRKVMAAKGRMSIVAITRSANLTPARAALLYDRMDASDISAASEIVAIIGGFNEEDGLPAHAEVDADGKVTLPLLHPDSGGEIELPEQFVMRRMTGADLIAIVQGGAKGADVTCNALARTTGMTPKEASAVFDAMDAEDIMALQRTVGFLSGSGQKTGR